jgi:ELWxxDGT repeat protein
MRLVFIILVIIINCLGFISCNGKSQGNSHPAADIDQENATLVLQVDWPDEPASSPESQAKVVKAAVDCGAMNVENISADVFSDAHVLLQTGGPWKCADKGGTISKVPARNNLIVRLSAFDINGQEVYRGEAPNVTVPASQTVNVSISMEYVFTRTVSMVQDINPGPGSSFPHRLFELQSGLCFVALDINAGFELFITGADGVDAQLLRDIHPNDVLDRTAVMAPTDFVELNGWLYFRANDGGGYHLWRTDGTSTSTAGGASFINPTELTVLGNKLFFSADSAGSGRELWVLDESSEEARQVTDIYPGQTGSNPHDLTASGNRLFFAADDGQTGYELWQTDRAATACSLTTDIYGGAQGSYPKCLTNVNGRLFFAADDDGAVAKGLWMLWYDSDNLNVVKADSQSGSKGTGGIRNLTWINGSMLALGFPGTTSGYGVELYLYDWQTDSAPQRIIDLNPGTASSYPANFVYLDGTLYFTASNSNNVEHLWAYSIDQQTLTCMTVDLPYPSPCDLTAVNQNLYFTASHPSFGRRLWATDGIRIGLIVTTNGENTQRSPSNLIAASNGRLYYSAFDADYGEELFVLDDQ